MARVLCIAAIAFISLFALDSFETGRTFWQNMGAFVIHLIPTFILLILLVIAWKRELTGGILITLTGLLATPFIFSLNYQRTHSAGYTLGIISMITLPFIIAGILFIVSHFVKRRTRTDEKLQ